MNILRKYIHGDGLKMRALRTAVWSLFGYGGGQVIRLLSNLILTRLLFPEAFGVMALVAVFSIGLAMMSDIGINTSIHQSKRGEDPNFLDTAWSLQILRGFLLYAVTLLVAPSFADFYATPELQQIIPIAGISLIIDAFMPTRVHTANRNLTMGRVVQIEIFAQFVASVGMVVVAFLTGSIWSLVIGSITVSVIKLIASYLYIEGRLDRFKFEREATIELIQFGKWITLSSFFTFFLIQGDRLVLGKYLTNYDLGIYNIASSLAMLPSMAFGVVTSTILIPIYREKPPSDSIDNFKKIQKMRFLLSIASVGMLFFTALIAVDLIKILYDPRYHGAGIIVVFLCLSMIPHNLMISYDQASLAYGDSRGYFFFTTFRSVMRFGAMVIGVEAFGLLGAIISMGVSGVLTYPGAVWLARRHKAWDPLHDLVFCGVGLGATAIATWVHWDAIGVLMAAGSDMP